MSGGGAISLFLRRVISLVAETLFWPKKAIAALSLARILLRTIEPKLLMFLYLFGYCMPGLLWLITIGYSSTVLASALAYFLLTFFFTQTMDPLKR